MLTLEYIVNPFAVLGGGKLRSQSEIETRSKSGDWQFRHGAAEQTEQEKKVSEALEKVGKELGGKSVTSVALAWVLAKEPNVFPVVGGRKVAHLRDNIEALSIRLSTEQMKFLEGVLPLEKGYPYNMIGDDDCHVTGELFNGVASSAMVDLIKAPKAAGYEGT